MGTLLLHHFAPPLVLVAPKPSITRRPSSSGPFSGCLNGPIPIPRLRFSLWDNAEYDDDEDDDFGFGTSSKRRNWWSDDAWDLDEEDDDDDDDDDDEFWGFKALKAFGWMVPAVVLSLVLGTGPNAFLMALAVPLGQTALSLAFDKVWGRTVNSPKPRRRKTKYKRKPFARAASSPRRTHEKGENTEASRGRGNSASRGRGNSQSWSTAAAKSGSADGKNATGFGGWDELDNQVWTDCEIPKGRTSQKASRSSKPQKGGKLSKRGRVRDTPLLVRLLVAVFPFLGSWTKLLL